MPWKKESKTTSMQDSIAAKKEYINLMQSEIALDEKQLEALKAAPVAANAAPKKEKTVCPGTSGLFSFTHLKA